MALAIANLTACEGGLAGSDGAGANGGAAGGPLADAGQGGAADAAGQAGLVRFTFTVTPPPTATPAARGSAVVGGTVTGSYVYTGDTAEDTTGNGSRYAFVTSPLSTLAQSRDGTVVQQGTTGGADVTYTPTAGDSGLHLFFCVTPVAMGANPGLEVCTAVGQVTAAASGTTRPVPSLSALPLMALGGLLGVLGWRRRRPSA
ncbi:hypothetical protein CCO03_08835 [Comamonas serinivorans]|uniref:IPTL-CTERM protein sorting domain-containing protein n=1 Tax=Comamonas serinivorans TaxID=1082851 RepID=A0A1Y0EMX6_9BURK|nr:hypothetical protein [Comamonas serinivorans]ARU04768.1 hypothetical protein CCO03_08835 [Comamonas serinivorans]